MSLISPADVANEVPGLAFNAGLVTGNELSESQVQGYIDAVEAEVQGRVAAHGYQWPSAPGAAATALRTVLLDGAVSRTLSALYALSSPDSTPRSVETVQRRYQAAIAALPELLRGLMAEAPATAGRAIPRLARTFRDPNDWEDLEDFTRTRDPVRLWPLLGRRIRKVT